MVSVGVRQAHGTGGCVWPRQPVMMCTSLETTQHSSLRQNEAELAIEKDVTN